MKTPNLENKEKINEIKEELKTDKTDDEANRSTPWSDITDDPTGKKGRGVWLTGIPTIQKRETIFHFLKHIFYADYWDNKRANWRHGRLVREAFELELRIAREDYNHKENMNRMEHKLHSIQGELLGNHSNLTLETIFGQKPNRDPKASV